MSLVNMIDAGTKTIIDVGTDHAYLPIYLVKNNIVESAIALDCLEGPIANAEKNIKKYGVEDRVKARISDGLSQTTEKDADVIVIAGMGSENIINILKDAKWVKSNKKTLILQPMTKDHLLREYLINNLFVTLKETTVLDSGKVYVAIKARYSGSLVNKACTKNQIIYPYIGTLLESKEITKETEQYIKMQINKLNKILSGIAKNTCESQKILEIINNLNKLIKISE